MQTSSRWPRVKEIVGAALERQPDDRNSYLDDACSGDQSLRREIESLLAAYAEADNLSHGPWQGEAADPQDGLPHHPESIGPYRLVRELGVGGMGHVWLAEQVSPVRRWIALKLIRAGMFDSSVVHRFLAERQSLALMDHPAIAKVFDAGATQNGQPWFAMEYVDGRPLTAYCDEKKLGIKDRLDLFHLICEGVQHAHQKAIIHRDLKPSNILVVEIDGRPAPRIIDFGLAKSTEPVLPGQQAETRIGMFVGTPAYMSPEQANPDTFDIDTRSDVYSLGVILYELLTGYLPFASNQRRMSLQENRQHAFGVADVERPSTKVASSRATSTVHAVARSTGLKELVTTLRGDLDWITLKALEVDRERRYGSPSDLARDITRHLQGLPVTAGPDTLWYRGNKFLNRHWLAVAATSAVLFAVGAGAAVATWQARRAERRFAQVRHLANVFLFDFEKSIHNVPGTTAARQLLVKTALEYLQSLSRDAAGDPGLMQELAAAYEKVGEIQGGSNLGNVGNSDQAVRSFKEAVRLRTALKESRPGDTANRVSLVKLLDKLDVVEARTGDLDSSLRDSQRAVSIAEELRREQPGNHQATLALTAAYTDLAFVEIRRTKVDDAKHHATQALDLIQPLAASAPGERDVQSELALTYWSLGSLSERIGDLPRSIEYFNKSLPLYEKLVADEPGDAEIRRRLMINLTGLATMQMLSTPLQPSDAKTAAGQARRAHDIATEAVKADPANAEAISDLVATSTRFGIILSTQGNYDEAKRVLQDTIHAAEELVARDPGSKENRLMLGQTHVWMANCLTSGKDLEGALRQRHQAEAILGQLAAEAPQDMKILDSHVWNLLKIGNLLAQQHDAEKAQKYYDAAIQIAEPLAPRHPSFAERLTELRQAKEEVSQEGSTHKVSR